MNTRNTHQEMGVEVDFSDLLVRGRGALPAMFENCLQFSEPLCEAMFESCFARESACIKDALMLLRLRRGSHPRLSHLQRARLDRAFVEQLDRPEFSKRTPSFCWPHWA